MHWLGLGLLKHVMYSGFMCYGDHLCFSVTMFTELFHCIYWYCRAPAACAGQIKIYSVLVLCDPLATGSDRGDPCVGNTHLQR